MGKAEVDVPPALRGLLDASVRSRAETEATTARLLDAVRNSPEARTARSSESTADALGHSLEQTQLSDQREQRMLFWTRVSAVAAIAAVLIGVIGIVVTVVLS